jgi:anaerobic selenocysteine-containing dehydrogenase
VLPVTIDTHKSFCRFCHAACAIEVDVEDGRAVTVRGDRSNPVFRGYTCIKGRQLPEQHNHPERLRQSLRRSGEVHEPIASTQALDEIAGKLRSILDRHGPRSVAVYCGTGAFQCATAIPMVRAWLKGIGSPSLYTSVTIDQPAKVISPARIGLWSGNIQSFDGADVVLMIGNNPLVSAFAPQGALPGFNAYDVLRRARKRGLKLICIDPRRSELARHADLHLQPKPGEDAALLGAIVRVVLEEGLYDAEFSERWVDGIDTLVAALAPFDLVTVSRRTGVAAADIETAARLFAAGPRGSASTGTGPSMAPYSALSEHLVCVLNAVCGRYNRAGEKLLNPGMLSPPRGYRAQVIPADAIRRGFRAGAKVRVRDIEPMIGEQPTSALAEEILMKGDGQVRALISVGGNPVVAFPDQLRTLEALDVLELLVSLDVKLGATARRSDYVIASTLSLERPDVPTTIDPWFEQPYTQYTKAIVEPGFDAVSEWEFFWELAKRMDTPLVLAGGAVDLEQKPSADDVLDAIYSKSRVPMSQVRTHEGGHVYEGIEVEVDEASPGADGRFTLAPADVLAEIDEVAAQATSAESIPGFDPKLHTHRLISRRLKHVLNSTGQHLSALRAKGSTNHAYMNPEDVAALGLAAGDVIRISSVRASILGVVAETEELRPGVVSMAHAWGDSPDRDGEVREIGATTGRLTDVTIGYDRWTGMPNMSAIPIAIERVSASGSVS